MAPASKSTTTSKRDKPPSEHAIKTLVANGLTLAQVKAMSPTKRNSLVAKAQNSHRDLQAAIGKATGSKKGKKSQSTSISLHFQYRLRLLWLLTPLPRIRTIEDLDNAAAEKNAANVLKKLQVKPAPTARKGKPPGVSKKDMANLLEDTNVDEEESEEEVIELQSRPKALHGRTFSGKPTYPFVSPYPSTYKPWAQISTTSSTARNMPSSSMTLTPTSTKTVP